MNQKEFVKYWREKEFKNYIPNYDKKVLLKAIKFILTLEDDFRKLDYDEKVKIVKYIFGDNEKYYKNVLDKEIKKSIEIGKQRLGL